MPFLQFSFTSHTQPTFPPRCDVRTVRTFIIGRVQYSYNILVHMADTFNSLRSIENYQKDVPSHILPSMIKWKTIRGSKIENWRINYKLL